MMTGILFTARLGSSRLPQKHLIRANGHTFIEWLMLRFADEFKEEIKDNKVTLIIATSDESINRKFEDVLIPGAKLFYGSVSNIPLRHLACAEAFGLSHIISIDGDDILCSPKGARKVYEGFKQHPEKDIVAVYGLPLGMNSSGYPVSYLRKSFEATSQSKIETGWGRIFTEPDRLEIKIGEYDIFDKIRFTLDYEDDALFFSTVINHYKDKMINASDKEIIKTVEENKFDKINSHLFDLYWANYNTLKESEQNDGQ